MPHNSRTSRESTMSTTDTSRRRFLLRTAAATAALPLLALLPDRQSIAALPPLPVTNAQAKALHYIEDAAKTDQSTRKPDSFCDNCQFHLPATNGCSIFPGFSVAPKGWCSAWALKK